MIDKEAIGVWIKSGAFRYESAIRVDNCVICDHPILRGDYYFSQSEKKAHFDCVLSEELLQELEREREVEMV